MKALFIGGSGIISTASTELAAKRGIDLTLATRGLHKLSVPGGVKSLVVDMKDISAAEAGA